MRMVILQYQLGLKLNMVAHRVRFWDRYFSLYRMFNLKVGRNLI